MGTIGHQVGTVKLFGNLQLPFFNCRLANAKWQLTLDLLACRGGNGVVYLRCVRCVQDKGEDRVPTYEYECRKCNRRFEVFHGIFDASARSCLKCKGPVVRLISGGGAVIVKSGGGGGFQPECGRNAACPGCRDARDTPPCAR